MWLELHLESAQLRGRELLREFGCLHLQLECFPLAKLGLLLRPIHRLQHDNCPIPNDATLDAPREKDFYSRKNRGRSGSWIDTQQQQNRYFDHRCQDGKDHAEREMQSSVGKTAFDRPPVAEPQ